MENITIRKGKRGDLIQVFDLIKELAEFEKAPHEVTTTLAQFEENGFGEDSLYDFFVAVNEDEDVLGAAIFYFGYSTWKGKMLYLDDIIITQRYRRRGIGLRLFERLVAHASDSNAKQMRWHVLDWNEIAINFYKKINADLDPEWITCKFNEEQLNAYKAHLST